MRYWKTTEDFTNAYNTGLLTGLEHSHCPGSGRAWLNVQGAPICPRCRRSPKQLEVTYPGRRGGSFRGMLPFHKANS